jgi:hypothetical protein
VKFLILCVEKRIPVCLDVWHLNKCENLCCQDDVLKDGGKSFDLANYPHMFMRWKEKFFVNVGTDCGLTIAGFYYVCFSRSDGSVHGFYYDPNSSPYQKLELKATNEGRAGYSFATYQFQ